MRFYNALTEPEEAAMVNAAKNVVATPMTRTVLSAITVAVTLVLTSAAVAAPESYWVLWDMNPKRARTVTLHPSLEVCTRASESAARADLASWLKRYSDVQGRVVPGDPQRTGPGTWSVLTQSKEAKIPEQVSNVYQCWPAGVTPQ